MKSLAEQLDDQARTSVPYEKAKADARVMAEETFVMSPPKRETFALWQINRIAEIECEMEHLRAEVARLRATLRALGFEDDLK